MKKRKLAPANIAELRRQAEERLKEKSGSSEVVYATAQEAQRLVHELQVHQIELELQNEELQRARAELEAGLEHYADLYDFAPVGYLTLGRDGAIRKVNLSGARLLRLERAGLMGRRLGLFVGDSSRVVFNAFIERVFESRAKEVCRIALHAENSEPVWAHIEATASEDGLECRAVVLDITENHRLEKTMQFRMELWEFAQTHSLEELLQKTLDHIGELTGSPIGFYHFVEPDQTTLSLQAWSTRTIKEFCAAEGQGLHYPIEQAGVWADCVRQRRPVIHNDYASLPHRKGLPAGHAVVTRELVVPIMRSDRIVAIAGVGNRDSDYTDRDVEIVSFLADVAWAIIERKRADEALHHSEQLFRGLFESMDEGFALCEMVYDESGCPVDFRYVDVNSAFARLTGIPVDRVVGRTVRELIPGIESQWIEAYGRVVKSGIPELIEDHVEGLGKHFEVHAWRTGVGRFAAVFSDVTQRKLAEEAVKKSEERSRWAAEALREAAHNKDHFLAVLSHELRTPLSPVLAAVSILQKRFQLDTKTHQTLEVVRRNVELEARLIDDLLDLTRIARGKIELQKQTVELCTIIHRAVEVCRPDIDTRGLHFGVDVGPAPYPVEADVARLQQVLWNLIKNAIKFTPSGGCVGIRCRPDADAHVVVEVNDSGAGIEPEALDRIFNAFEQAEGSIARQFGGLGLGLAISKTLVELHGGTIEARSPGKGKGATFRLRLPLVTDAARRVPATGGIQADEVPEPKLPALRILLVEDHGDTAEMMQQVFESEGHQVCRAGDVKTALHMAPQENFDLLVSDLGLPDGSGLELMRDLRARGCDMPGIALTGYGHEQDVQRSREAGFAAHVVKPADMDHLLRVVADVVRLHYDREASG